MRVVSKRIRLNCLSLTHEWHGDQKILLVVEENVALSHTVATLEETSSQVQEVSINFIMLETITKIDWCLNSAEFLAEF